MDRKGCMEQFQELLRAGTSPFHVTAELEKRFLAAGYERLPMDGCWRLGFGGKFYVVQQESTLIAFSIGRNAEEADGFRIAAAHTDFPGFRIKQRPELLKDGYAQLNVEVYGGAILNTWLDRPLSAAGRVALKDGDVFHPQIRLVDFKRPLFVIPNLAIHLNKEINKGVELNKQKELLPIAGMAGEMIDGDFFRRLLAEELGAEPDDILDYELGIYNADEPCCVGIREEFLSSPRIDNLSGVQAVAGGMVEGGQDGINVAAFFDHEEIGSRTKQGAGSELLNMLLERISLGLGRGREEYLRSLSGSMLLSVDVGHAFHPNYAQKMDLTNTSPLNRGICIKEACAQSYATDSRAVGIVQQICIEEGIPYTKYFNRSDGTSGSTLGAIASGLVPVSTVDVGVPILAMHSARELMGASDEQALMDLVKAYYTL